MPKNRLRRIGRIHHISVEDGKSWNERVSEVGFNSVEKEFVAKDKYPIVDETGHKVDLQVLELTRRRDGHRIVQEIERRGYEQASFAELLAYTKVRRNKDIGTHFIQVLGTLTEDQLKNPMGGIGNTPVIQETPEKGLELGAGAFHPTAITWSKGSRFLVKIKK